MLNTIHSLAEPALAQVMVRTIDTGGAGPVSGLLEARRMILSEGCQAVAVVAGDAVSSLDTAEFLERADRGFNRQSGLPSPCIPHGYNRIAECVAEPCFCLLLEFADRNYFNDVDLQLVHASMIQSLVLLANPLQTVRWQMETYGVTREQLAMVSVLMSRQVSP